MNVRPITIFIYHHKIIITIYDIDQSLAYFVCGVCGFTFRADPNFTPSPIHSVGVRVSLGPEIEL